jgi:trypsin-like peptidase
LPPQHGLRSCLGWHGPGSLITSKLTNEGLLEATKLGWRAFGSFFGACVVSMGCAGQLVESTYADEFDCHSEVQVEDLDAGRFRASGCNKSVVYVCARSVCAVERMADATPPPAFAPPPATAAPQGKFGVAHLEKSKSGASVVALELRLDDETLLKLRGLPGATKPVTLQLVRLEGEEPKANCELAAMINGQRIALPKVEQQARTSEAQDGRMLSTLRSELSTSLVRELAVARQLSLKHCQSRWSVSERDAAELRHFAQLYQEEQAWQRTPSEGGSGGLIAPAGGWPGWTVTAKAPAAAVGPALDAPTLFKLLSPSVFKVVVASGEGDAQGSAIAVSPTELLTNCHVLEGAQTVSLRQGKLTRTAQLARANPTADRCVLVVSEANLTPIRGVRQYAELQVGEPLYTLGSPSGLELSLAGGLLSGKREEGSLNYVQTTAPISPGSSGGGLFDARGNLVGVTTLVLAGRERLNQSLNFAIPAEAFWQP